MSLLTKNHGNSGQKVLRGMVRCRPQAPWNLKMREATIPQSEEQIPREATLEGSDRRLPRPRHATVPRPRHLRYEQQCWTPELRNMSIPVTSENNCEKLT